MNILFLDDNPRRHCVFEENFINNVQILPFAWRDIMVDKRLADFFFPEAQRQASVMEGRCVQPPFGCGKPVRETDWKDDLSRKEFQISGLCQKCQDKFFDN